VSQSGQDFGANDWLVEEMYERYQADPSSVPTEWVAHFQNNPQVAQAPKGGTPPTPKPVTPPNISVQGSMQPSAPAPVATPPVTPVAPVAAAPAPVTPAITPAAPVAQQVVRTVTSTHCDSC
jgi:multifunctional 2-oxoglutarate metabolism enzyme